MEETLQNLITNSTDDLITKYGSGSCTSTSTAKAKDEQEVWVRNSTLIPQNQYESIINILSNTEIQRCQSANQNMPL